MSDLQFGLLAVGALVVVGVLAYNKWQETRFRREADGRLKSGHDDVLMSGRGGAAAATADRPRGERFEGRVEPTFDTSPGSGAGEADPSGASLLSDPIDFIVTLEASEDVDGGDLLDGAAAPLAGFSKPVHIEGYSLDTGAWEPPLKGRRYTLMRAGLQLVDRRGPVSNDELATFGAGVQQAAAAAGALATVPDRSEAMARATELDEFCGSVDILISMHVVSRDTPFPGAKIRALAEANGLALENDGRFRKRDDQGRILYELASLDATPFGPEAMRSSAFTGLALEFDVPRTPEPARVFGPLRDLAHQLAQALDGKIVDEKRADISAAAFDQILARIQAVQGAMAARSIPPGGSSALRLFF